MKIPLKSLLMYLVAGLLLAWYVGVLVLSANPRVPPEYRLYYIEHELLNWPGYGGLDYTPGERIGMGTQPGPLRVMLNRGRSWYGREPWGNWSEGERASLYFVLPEPPATDLTLRVLARAYTAAPVKSLPVLVNGVQVGALELRPGPDQIVSLNLPQAALAAQPVLQITFLIPEPESPAELEGTLDTRQLGIGLVWLELLPPAK